METHPTAAHRYRLWLLLAACGFTVWNAFGTLGDDTGYTGALYWPDYTIPFVEEGGVLEEAGFQAGDSVVSVEGTPVEELGMYSRWPRSLDRRPGESLAMTVDRDGARVEGRVVFRERPADVTGLRLGVSFVGLAFLWIGVGMLFLSPSVHAAGLAVIGLVAGVGLPGPSLGTWNGVRDHVQLMSELLLLVLLVRYFLHYPRPWPAAGRTVTKALLWVPSWALAACLAVELAFHPRYYHTFGGFFGLLLLGYLLALVGVVTTVAIRTPAPERRASGLGVVLVGFGLVLVPNLVALAAWFVPGLTVPGAGFLPLLIALLPLAMALGILRHAPELPGEAD